MGVIFHVKKKKIYRKSDYRVGGVRRIEGVSLIWATQGTAGTSRSDAKGEVQAVKPQGESTNAENWGGSIRSSKENCESRRSEGIELNGRRTFNCFTGETFGEKKAV